MGNKRLGHLVSSRVTRGLLLVVWVAALAAVLAACGGGGDSTSSSSGGETGETVKTGDGGESGKTVKVAVILKDAAAPFWQMAEEGAKEAASELGSKVDVSYTGVKSEEDAPGQINAVENAITEGAEGIVIAPTVPEAVKPILEKVSGEGVNVVVIDQTIEGYEPTSMISTNNVKGGELGAEAMLEAVKDGEVAIISGPPGLEGTDERAEGFVSGVEGKLDVAAELPSACDVSSGVKDAENMITGHPNLAAIYSVCGLPALGAVEAAKGAGLLGKITLVGWDANTSDAQLKNIESGIEFAGVAQHPEYMGKTGVEYAYKASIGESVPKKVESPTSLVTKANVAEYK